MKPSLHRAAVMVVGRDCGFASSVIIACALRWGSGPQDVLKIASVFSLFLCFLLMLRASIAARCPLGRTDIVEMTEVDVRHRRRPDHLRIAEAIRLASLMCALHAAYASAAAALCALSMDAAPIWSDQSDTSPIR